MIKRHTLSEFAKRNKVNFLSGEDGLNLFKIICENKIWKIYNYKVSQKQWKLYAWYCVDESVLSVILSSNLKPITEEEMFVNMLILG